MEQNHTRSYILYALGEIILVMVGILLALQVNNWNEDRKERLLEQNYLIRLHEDMQSSINNVEDNIRSTKEQLELMDNMMRLLERPSLTTEEYGKFATGIFRFGKILPPSLVTGTLDELSATGRIVVLQNDSLRQALQNLEGLDDNLKEIQSYIVSRATPHIVYIDSRVTMYRDDNGNYRPENEEEMREYIVFDFAEFRSDPKILNAISTMNHLFGVLLSFNEQLEARYEEIIPLLNEQITLFNN